MFCTKKDKKCKIDYEPLEKLAIVHIASKASADNVMESIPLPDIKTLPETISLKKYSFFYLYFKNEQDKLYNYVYFTDKLKNDNNLVNLRYLFLLLIIYKNKVVIKDKDKNKIINHIDNFLKQINEYLDKLSTDKKYKQLSQDKKNELINEQKIKMNQQIRNNLQ